ncbi:tetratricopeptide repeat protein [Alphaproteobacteria bacterium LSUCC0719]
MTRRGQAGTRAEQRQSPLPWMLAAALVALALGIASGLAHAAGSDSSGSDSSGSSYGSASMSKDMRKASYYINKQDYKAALTHLEAEIATNPDSADAWNLTGFAARNLGDYARSEVAYDRALAINPAHKGALEYKGELYLKLGNLAGAEALLARLSKVCSFNCEEKKELAEAIEAYKKAN